MTIGTQRTTEDYIATMASELDQAVIVSEARANTTTCGAASIEFGTTADMRLSSQAGIRESLVSWFSDHVRKVKRLLLTCRFGILHLLHANSC